MIFLWMFFVLQLIGITGSNIWANSPFHWMTSVGILGGIVGAWRALRVAKGVCRKFLIVAAIGAMIELIGAIWTRMMEHVPDPSSPAQILTWFGFSCLFFSITFASIAQWAQKRGKIGT
ncbi:hypothetical protein [Melghirimyces algeriensis]|uniref:Uncharacterized protein n=1 Tax=Melghirimyces algeriensis TaxID=910412 RepID=A0A521FA09_9BACL|nr:hypothetical protein [Melghirimyces algeriensis]SMO93062.1 hypothetical protein SAMN06264849_11536 [Melghirimyces algeriensis]